MYRADKSDMLDVFVARRLRMMDDAAVNNVHRMESFLFFLHAFVLEGFKARPVVCVDGVHE